MSQKRSSPLNSKPLSFAPLGATKGLIDVENNKMLPQLKQHAKKNDEKVEEEEFWNSLVIDST